MNNTFEERVKLLIGYKLDNTLTENYKKIIINETALSSTAESIAQTFREILQNDRSLFGQIKTEVPLFREFKTADELLTALNTVGKDGSRFTNAEIMTMVKDLSKNKEIFNLLKGTIKDSKSFKEIAQQVYPKGLAMGPNAKSLEMTKKYYKNLGIEGKEVEQMLKDSLAKGSSAKMGPKFVKGSGKESQAVLKDIEVGKNIKSETELGKLKTQKGKWEGFKNLARIKGLKVLEYAKKLGWKKIIMYGAAGWLAIYLWRNWFSAKPKLWSQCLIDFVGYNNFSKAVQIKPGILSVKGKTGLQSLDMNGYTYFRNDGTAKNGQFEGTWECDGEKLVLEFDGQEYYPVKGSVTPVVTDGGVGGGNSTTDGGGGTVTQPTYRACSGTYNKGCKSEVIRKVQGCLGVKMDGLFGPKTEAAVQSKLGKLIFSDSDVDGICGIAQITPTPTPTPTPISEPKLVEPESVASVDDFLKGF